MIFEKLGNLKVDAVSFAIVMAALGFIFVICPEDLVSALINTIALIMLITAVVMVLEFMTSERSAKKFIKLGAALFLGVVGLIILVVEIDTLYVIAWLFGVFLIVDGFLSLVNAFTYARRSGKKAWWVLLILAAFLMLVGLAVVVNPWWDTPKALLRVTGTALFYSSVVNAIRIFWVWPFEKKKGGADNA